MTQMQLCIQQFKNQEQLGKAMESLLDIGEPAIPHLIQALQDKDDLILWGAVRTLKEMSKKSKAAFPALVQALQNEHPGVRWGAIWALSEMEKDAASAVLPDFIQALQDNHEAIRILAASVLGRMGKDAASAVPDLMATLQDIHPDVPLSATSALSKIAVSLQDNANKLSTSELDRAISNFDATLKVLQNHKLEFSEEEIVSIRNSLVALRHERQHRDKSTGAIVEIQQTTSTTRPQKCHVDVEYYPTSTKVIDKIMEMAKLTKDDILYDLGSGDGRIPITAAKKFGSRGIGIEIYPERISKAKKNAEKAGVGDRVQFFQQDLFKTDFSEATVVTFFLLPEINIKLRPQLLKQLKPGTRVISHYFGMGDWKPDQLVEVDSHQVYMWTIPLTK